MDTSAILKSIRMAIGQGELDRAFDEAIAFLETEDKYSELLNTVRINQGSLRQTKNQASKGIISVTEARQATNIVTDNLLIVADMVERGDFSFKDGPTNEAIKKIQWRAYILGGLAVLVAGFLLWKFQAGSKTECPNWGKGPGFNVMILPFKTLGNATGKTQPQIELMDFLDAFSEKNGIGARIDVNESYDIEKNYPSSAEAVALAQTCAAQMVIWGKINQKTAENYTIDVKYRLLDAGGIKMTGDTTITRLLANDLEGGFSEDIERVARFLSVVIANRLQRSDVALKIMEKSLTGMIAPADSGAKTTLALAEADTSLRSQMAFAYAAAGQPKKAVEQYSKVLAANPKNWSAMQNRGIARYAAKDFEGAAIDLENAQSVSKSPPTVDMLRIQTEANLQSNRLDAAKTSLEDYQKTRGSVDKWTLDQKAEYEKRLALAEKERSKSELAANQQPNDARLNLRAANNNLKLGNGKKATQFADRMLKKQPKSAEAWAVKIEAANHEDGTEAAQKLLEEAESKGVQARDIVKFRPIIAPLVIEKKEQ